MSVATEAELTAWEAWDEQSTKLYQAVCDTEQDMHDADAEVRDADERIEELEAELQALKVRRSRFALKHSEATNRLASAQRKYGRHQELEPEQD